METFQIKKCSEQNYSAHVEPKGRKGRPHREHKICRSEQEAIYKIYCPPHGPPPKGFTKK